MEWTAIVSMVIPLLAVAVMWGDIKARVKQLERKMDKHNNVVERLARIEQHCKEVNGGVRK